MVRRDDNGADERMSAAIGSSDSASELYSLALC